MRGGQRIGVVIPARNEAAAIGRVLGEIPVWVDAVVVADNGSRDGTGSIAQAAGAQVVVEPEPGYGAACLAALAVLGDAVDIAVFIDGDYSDYPAQMDRLVDPIVRGDADLVIGSRVLGRAEAGSLTPVQRFGNRLATTLIRRIWGVRYTDLGPFRAIRRPALTALAMVDRNYGWTVEMQIKAAQGGLAVADVPVDYRRRIGRSKVSGTVTGSVRAGVKILGWIGWAALRR